MPSALLTVPLPQSGKILALWRLEKSITPPTTLPATSWPSCACTHRHTHAQIQSSFQTVTFLVTPRDKRDQPHFAGQQIEGTGSGHSLRRGRPQELLQKPEVPPLGGGVNQWESCSFPDGGMIPPKGRPCPWCTAETPIQERLWSWGRWWSRTHSRREGHPPTPASRVQSTGIQGALPFHLLSLPGGLGMSLPAPSLHLLPHL